MVPQEYLDYSSHSLAYEITHIYKNWLPLYPWCLSCILEVAHTLSIECVSSLNKPSFTLLMACSLLNFFLHEAKNPYLVAVPGTQMWPRMWPSSQDPLFLARVLPAHRKCLLMHQTERWLSSSSFPIMLLEHSYYDTLLGNPLKSQGSQLNPISKGPKKWQTLFKKCTELKYQP